MVEELFLVGLMWFVVSFRNFWVGFMVGYGVVWWLVELRWG